VTHHCSIHRGDVPGGVEAVLVGAIEQGSGPGIGIYACRPCADQHHVVPFAEPDDEGLRRPEYPPPTGIRRAP
jgi:hypothetical protein